MRVFRIAQFAGAGLFALALTACPGPQEPRPRPEPTPTPIPVPTPTPPPYVPNKRLEVGKVFNGMQYRVTLETEDGTTTSKDRSEPESYVADLTVKVKVPKPHRDLEEIQRLNPSLSEVLPGLPALLEVAKVSPSFDNLYRLKCNALQASLMRLDNLLTRHNFYDCETILELQHPESKRRALFIQGDMDVDTDGSDSDRVLVVEGASSTFQPFTSYRWAKRTDNPSPFVAPREAKLKQYEEELAMGGVTAARREELKLAQTRLRSEIAELGRFSYLIGAADPFIVLPGSMFGKSKGPFAPSVGDYCVVVFQKTLYPAIVGDVGPTNLVGEASLRLCKELNPRANAENRPTSDLKVTYIVFPGTAEKFDVPDLPRWQARCKKLIDEIGGHQGELFVWEDITKLKPPAEPAPATSTAPPAASPSPATPKP